MLEFDLYIGQKMFYGQDKKIIAIVVPRFDIPASQYDLNGNVKVKQKNQHFSSFVDLNNYFSDWLELLADRVQVKVTVYLNVFSLTKVFKDNEILQLIKNLDSFGNYSKIRSFDEIV